MRPAPSTGCRSSERASWSGSRSTQSWVLEEGSKMHDRRASGSMPEAPLLRQLPQSGKLVLRGGPEVRGRAGAALGFPLPERALTATAGEGAEALWLGPDEWLILVPPASADAVEAALRSDFAGLHH